MTLYQPRYQVKLIRKNENGAIGGSVEHGEAMREGRCPQAATSQSTGLSWVTFRTRNGSLPAELPCRQDERVRESEALWRSPRGAAGRRPPVKVVYPGCAGIDIHKQSMTLCLIVDRQDGSAVKSQSIGL